MISKMGNTDSREILYSQMWGEERLRCCANHLIVRT